MLTILVFIILAELSFNVYRNIRVQEIEDHLRTMSYNHAQRIQESLLRKVYVVETLEVMLALTDYNEGLFYQWAPTIYKSEEEGMAAVQLAPEGVVEYIYPLEGHEGAIGHNLLDDSRRDEGARLAIENDTVTFVGPLRLIQNNKLAVISRKPVFRYVNGNKEFWGFTIVLIHIEDLLITELRDIEKEGYTYRILGNNPDSDRRPVVMVSNEEVEEWETTYPIIVPGGRWTFQMARIQKPSYTMAHLLIYLIALLIVTIYLLQHYRMVRQSAEIERLNEKFRKLSYMDDLTELKNRRGVYLHLEEWMQEATYEHRHLTIAIIDVDYFKHINDTYGHGIGDLALQYVSQMIKEHLTLEHIMGRLGGDEFICAFHDASLVDVRKAMEHLCDCLHKAPYKHKTIEMPITVSIGLAQYQGEELEEFLDRADQALYTAKANGRNQVSYRIHK